MSEIAEPAGRVHVWYHCHNCGAEPIVGRRFECQTCPAGPDNDLCEKCFQAFQRGEVKHPGPDSAAAHGAQTPKAHAFKAFEGVHRQQYIPWLGVPQPAAVAAPRVPDHFVVRPEFCTASGGFFGSYAFALRPEDGSPMVITALHVLDELIKDRGIDCSLSNAAYTGQELARTVRKVNLYDVYAPRWPLALLGSASSMLALADARLGEEEPCCQRDLAAFHADSGARLTPGVLAAAAPGVGEPVWLCFNTGKGAAGSRTVQAVVVEHSERALVYRFAPSSVTTTHSSGAPLVNRAGEVVGICVGGGAMDGQRFGHALHAASVRRHLGLGDQRPGY
jgi:hypothetical protein